jgi:hypothetical protein
MSETFDPYHRWLGIRPKDQPPNHYRLLGVDLFEDDPEAIIDAAQRQMAHVRTYQLGPTSAISQKILNELAAAKACLLDPQGKAEYDTTLRAQIAATNPSPPPPAQPPSPPSPTQSRRPSSSSPPPPPPALAPPTKRPWQVIAAMGAGAVLICLALGTVLLRSGGKKEKEVAQVQVASRSKVEGPWSQPPRGEKSTIAPKSNAGSESNPASLSKGPATPPATPSNTPSSVALPTQPSEHRSTANNSAAPSVAKPAAMPPVAAPTEKPTEAMPQAAVTREPSSNSRSAESNAPDVSSAAQPVAVAPLVAPGEKRPDDSSLFVGQWGCGDVAITLKDDFTAYKNTPQNPLGKWECVNGEAHVAWDDGMRTVLRSDRAGFRQVTWKAGASPPAFTFPAAKKGNHEAEPTPIPFSRPTVAEQNFVPLFNGRNLKGWHLRNPRGPFCWSVKRGELTCTARGKGLDLITDKAFQDFELALEFMLGPRANSGVYLRGLYEVQLADGLPLDKKGCGAIYNEIAPSEEAYLGPARWNTLNVRMVGQRVTVTMNGKCVIDNAEVTGPTDKKFTLPIREGEPGPIILQCLENEFRFRNIRIRPLK